MTERETVTIKEAQAIAGVTRRTICNWLASGKIQYIRTAGKGIRIYRDTLHRCGNVEPETETPSWSTWPKSPGPTKDD